MNAGAHAAAPPRQSVTRRRWLARGTLLAVLASLLVPLAATGVRGSIGLVVVTVGALVVALAAGWWFLTRRGVVRWLAAALAVLAPVAAFVIFARSHLLWVVVVALVLWVAAGAAGAAALTESSAVAPREREVPPPKRPFLIMNPRSGGGKVERFDLVEKARAAGAEVFLIEGGDVDVAAVARDAVARGVDLLGVAGGDGTQALVAGIAAEHGLPFLVISAGTRNHFALDLGLDRDDPSRCLDALTDGVEVLIDLGTIGDRTFVNNASFGAYAAVVQSPAYRDDKMRTSLDLLPDLLVSHNSPGLLVSADGQRLTGPQAVLVSNNPYAWDDIAGLGKRPRIDGRELGVVAVTIDGTGDAVRLVRGLRSRGIWRASCPDVVVDADQPTVPVGVDGEALLLPTPVRCTIRPGALRVRVPRHRPGLSIRRARPDWGKLRALAFSRDVHAG